MADDHKDETTIPDPAELAELWANIGEKSQEIVKSFLARQDTLNTGPIDPLNVGNAFFELTQQMLNNPAKMVEAQISLWQDYMELWQATTRKALGEESQPVVTPEQGDNRFKNEAWNDDGLFDFIKQSYLLTARWVQNTVHDVEGLDEKTAEKVDFYTRQYVDALAPTNFLMTNPQVLKETFDSKGENILKGLEHLLEDLERGKGKLSIKMVDQDAFDVGENIATTHGKVVFQNDLIQLLQFSPTTEKVAEVPLLIIPPWINKYYILDLREKNSFIRWAVSKGLTVFCISWVNPDGKLAQKSFEDYMVEGPLAALAAIESATGQKEANAIGYCLGGTLLAATLACMRKNGDDRIKAATFFTSMIDFEEPGELGVFIDDDQLSFINEKMKERGYLDGSEMATTFNMLRANDLIWSFVINNYLMGKEPFPFDLLYWNSDSTRMPATMHSFYLHKMYRENKLVEPGGITLMDTDVDLSVIDIPTFILSTREDHIAPWKSTYRATQIYGGPVTFTLAASGHIAGVVNPPEPEKYGFWTNSKKPKDPDAWFACAKEHKGSWWPTWRKWLAKYAGEETDARVPGDSKLPALEDAPGSYVKVRTE
ncbi:MAG: class I poly(R)-hydroxyalkanoic acid synthase [Rhodospirillaceae bacterium]|nr:class I poly(R)-hydroxyalkanoic acid synthase [Rhodospirillaceae bacterium]